MTTDTTIASDAHTAAQSEILDAWQRRQEAYDRYNALPFADTFADTTSASGAYTPEEREQWAIIDQAEKVIQESVAKTPGEVSVQLWTSLQHTLMDREEDAAACRGDLAFFEARDEDLDWTARLTIAALRSLKAMEA